MSRESNDRRMESDLVRSGRALGFSQQEVEQLLADPEVVREAIARIEHWAAEPEFAMVATEMRKRVAWLRGLASQ